METQNADVDKSANLPKIDRVVEEIEYFPIKTTTSERCDEYWAFCKQLETVINSDCRAMTVQRRLKNGKLSQKEILFNFYRESDMTLAELIDESVRRNALGKGIHSELLCHIHRSNVKTFIELYFYSSEDAEIITIIYDPNFREYGCTFRSAA